MSVNDSSVVVPFPKAFANSHDMSLSDKNVLSCRVKNGVFDEELLDDLEQLTAMELRKKYKAEAHSHTSRKNHCKGAFSPLFEQFRDFLRHAGKCPHKGWTLDRIDNSNPDYAPHLCRWASKKQQNTNKGDSILLSHGGKKMPLTVWAELTNQKPDTLRARRKRAWSDTAVIFGRRRVRQEYAPNKSQWELLLPKTLWHMVEESERAFRASPANYYPHGVPPSQHYARAFWLDKSVSARLERLMDLGQAQENDHVFHDGPPPHPTLQAEAENIAEIKRRIRAFLYPARHT